MDRRRFLLTLAAGTLAALTACDVDQRHSSTALSYTNTEAPPTPSAAATSSPLAVATPTTAPSISTPAPLPGVAGTWTQSADGRPPSFLNSLPGTGRQLALTVDDGVDSAVVGAYLDFIESAGIRLTFFLNGINPSWTEHAKQLRPLVESGQVQLGNHTWSHPDITKLADKTLTEEIKSNDTFIRNTYGVDARPYFRPPFGFHNAHTDHVLAGLGYTTQTLWYGSFGDSGLITEDQLMTLARQWMLPQHIVIGHANHPTVTHLYGQLLDLIRERQLELVTLNDIFDTPHAAVSR